MHTVITLFFGVDGIALLDVLLQGWKLKSEYVQENMIRVLAIEKDPTPRQIDTPRDSLQFEPVLIQNTEKVKQTLDNCDCPRLEHPPYTRFISMSLLSIGCLRETMILLSYEIAEQIERAVTDTIARILRPQVIAVFGHAEEDWAMNQQ
jgi:hypothetical protein